MQEYFLEELSQGVARELERRNLLGAAADHRVSAAPDARTLRYYTTLGLLDRPLVQGRRAGYGPRHLLQLLTVKALQSQGPALGEIQACLYGRGDVFTVQIGNLPSGEEVRIRLVYSERLPFFEDVRARLRRRRMGRRFALAAPPAPPPAGVSVHCWPR